MLIKRIGIGLYVGWKIWSNVFLNYLNVFFKMIFDLKIMRKFIKKSLFVIFIYLSKNIKYIFLI